MKSSEIRQSFLRFFENKNHLVMKSSSLIPDDPTMLLTTAGMVQFKPYFLGLAEPPKSRITTVQKCVRTSDIEEVGKTARHLTFFEMLGNFSFGDYYKREAIKWASEFLFDEIAMDISKFWVTIYKDDDQAYHIWRKELDFPEKRIVRLGEEDNFWKSGSTGPCGPCSELLLDRGEEYGCGKENCIPGCDCERFLEIWNLVFMQYERDEKGLKHELPQKNIDTGMGLERLAMILQDVDSVFKTDLFFPIINKASQISGIKFEQKKDTDLSLKIICDHIRASTFLIADGVFPSNEGRGYILRRLIRRAVRHGRLLGMRRRFLPEIASSVVEIFKNQYRELSENEKLIYEILKNEEDKFARVLDKGLEVLSEELESLPEESNVFPGKSVFRLYDTYGFPPELTKEILSEKNYRVDLDSFEKILEKRREKSRKSWKGNQYKFSKEIYLKLAKKMPAIDFVGYQLDRTEAEILAILVNGEEVKSVKEGQKVEIILNKTPFYAESGGQVSDTGYLGKDKAKIEVLEVQKPDKGVIVHRGKVKRGRFLVGDTVKAVIDKDRRRATERNHTSTHLLQWALRLVLGEHIKQTGSFVSPDYFRFDFPHETALEKEQIEKIEKLINGKILESHPVRKYETTISHAREIGAIALFGEKYEDYVRVVEVGNFSRELCGGTHVDRTSQIGMFKITSERSIGAGMRRIEAVSGHKAFEFMESKLKMLEEIYRKLGVKEKRLLQKINEIIEENKKLKKKVEKLSSKQKLSVFDELLEKAEKINGITIIKGVVKNKDSRELRELVDFAKNRLNEFALVVGGLKDNKPTILVAASEKVISSGVRADHIARISSKKIKGGGGGTKRIAEAGGKEPDGIENAVEEGFKFILDTLKK